MTKKDIAQIAENVYDQLCDAWQSDMEHGVRCLNEKAVQDFKENYPEINVALGRVMSFLAELADMGEGK